MSLLTKKLKQGSPRVSPQSVIRADFLLLSKVPRFLRVYKASPFPHHYLSIFLIHLCYPDEPKTLKTAWEYYNEGTLAIINSHHRTSSNLRTQE